MKALLITVALFAVACAGNLHPEEVDGVERIARSTSVGVEHVLGGGPIDGRDAGMASGEWDHRACVEAETMRDLLVAVVDVGMPALVAWANGVEFEVPSWERPNYDARCEELAP